ncbi:Cthe_2314 family HEPN domain-containing protein [Thalassorhabdus alkalitolerans]|uniref:Cthe_2314 family HEPN domain-containing protein n=1 Tax=Thalassorhabdus alkalitolerans TaxID=2282697 RepID=A0ABW0YNJ7_9BACI
MKTFYITPFEDISKVKINDYANENPLQIPDKSVGLLFYKEGNIFQKMRNRDMNHWESVLHNRLLSIQSNFGYAMFYYYRGIPDDEWYISPGDKGQSVQFFPHFEEKHYSNQYNFSFFADTFFLKAFTVFETIAHLLYKHYEIEVDESNFLDKVSFNNALHRMKNIDKSLSDNLFKIKKSSDFKKGVKMRNDIAHNHPPYLISSGITLDEKGASYGVGDYTSSTEIKETMIGLLRSIQKTMDVLEKHLS